MNGQNILVTCIVCSGLITLIVLGSICVVMLTDARTYYSSYPDLQDTTNWTLYEAFMVQNRDLWHWEFNVNNDKGDTGYIEVVCTSVQYDVRYRNAKHEMLLRSDQKIFSIQYKTEIHDAIGRILYLVYGPRFFTSTIDVTIVNNNGVTKTIQASLYIQAPNGTVLAYVEGPAYATSLWNLTDSGTGLPLIQVARQEVGTGNYFSGMYNWRLSKLADLPMANGPMMLVILGQMTFQQMAARAPETISVSNGYSRTVKEGNADECDNFYWGTSWAVLAVVLAAFLLIVFLWYEFYLRDRLCGSSYSNAFWNS